MCAGITPNIELARDAKIKVAKGIVVSDTLETSTDHIYAIGECSEHRGKTYGLAAPGLEQASILANHLNGDSASYNGSTSVSRLKVVGQDVCSMGEVADLPNRPRQYEASYKNASKNEYRKIAVHHQQLIGAVGIGNWPEQARIQELFFRQGRVAAWQAWWFSWTGKLWFDDSASSVSSWPSTATVCQCNNVSKGELADAINTGCNSIAALQTSTRAATVCGSCKPLLSELLGSTEPPPKVTAWPVLLVACCLALITVALIGFLPEAKVADSFQAQTAFEGIWNDKFWKQVTGFSLLGLSLLGLVMSLRKRLKLTWLGNFDYLRLFHSVLGLLCALILIAHTGFHLGSNLNQILMIDFIAVLVLGASTGGIVALSHTLKPARERALKKLWSWLHILGSWPLPALIGAHILTVYYF